MFNPFNAIRKISAWFSEGISTKAKVIIALFVLLFIIGVGYIGYRINDYFENDPKACNTCHVHDDANKMWEKSVHQTINCHECHHASKKEQVVQMYRFAFLGQKSVTPRHGNIIVAWKICYRCHWEKDEKYPTAKPINTSRFHAKHLFMEKLECVHCHGYRTHQFNAEPKFCVKCHQDKEVHGTGMGELACLNCHTDRTKDLKPGRKKCLFCHGGESVRRELISDGTLDVTHYMPDEKTINKAIKIVVPDKAPMQFDCYECHKPHKSARPDWGNCLSCHQHILNVGKHNTHVQVMGMKCKQCHKPHIWTVKPEQAKKDCVSCHEYRDPKSFLGP